MKRRIIIVSALAVLAGLSACKTSKKSVSSAPKAAPDKGMPAWAREQKEDVTYIFYNAVKEKMSGNGSNALALFKQVLRSDPNNAAASYNIAQIYLAENKQGDALPYITRASDLDPQNIWYTRTKAEALLRANKMSAAAAIYEKLIKDYPDEQEYYFSLITTLMYSSKPNEALKVYDRMEARFGVSPELIMLKEKLYIKLGKIDKAAAEIEKLIREYPKEPQYYGILAELYQANGLMDKALATFKKMEELDPNNPLLQLSLYDYYRTANDKAKASEILHKIIGNSDIDIDAKLKILANDYYNHLQTNPELMPEALELNRLLVQTHPQSAAAHTFYGEFLSADKQTVAPLEQFRIAKNLDRKTLAIWQSLLGAELKMKEYNALSVDADSAIELFPNQPVIYYLSGLAKIQLKHYDKAVLTLQDGAKQVVDNKALLADIYSNIGEAYFREKKNKSSDDAFDKALDADPKNANTLNNYSYYLSLRGDSLSKAEKMSRLSNELEPNNSYYEDTYGWILYKESKYAEAKEWLEKALQSRDGDSGTTMEHYGDLVYKLGDTEKAYEYWLKAQRAGGGSELLDKKISAKKLFE